MPAKRVFGPTRVHSKAANPTERCHVLDVQSGGSKAKTGQYAVVGKLRSSTNAHVKLVVEHGLDGQVFATHSTAISYAEVPEGGVLMGDADTSKILGEHRRCLLYIKDTTEAAEVWAVVEVWEMLKPF